MKRFRLLDIPSPLSDLTPEQSEADRVDYIACIRQVIRAPMNPSAGVQLEEMDKGLRVLRALEGKKLGDVLELEDADHAHLCEKVRTTRWAVVDERLARFSHTVLNATEDVVDLLGGSSAASGRLDSDDKQGRNGYASGSTDPNASAEVFRTRRR